MTQCDLALAADLSRVQIARIESGVRRTRRSTLRRIACVLVVENPRQGPVDQLLNDLVAMAGPALAEESAYAERVGRRRAVRSDKAVSHDPPHTDPGPRARARAPDTRPDAPDPPPLGQAQPRPWNPACGYR